jgi:hypothetical protein
LNPVNPDSDKRRRAMSANDHFGINFSQKKVTRSDITVFLSASRSGGS